MTRPVLALAAALLAAPALAGPVPPDGAKGTVLPYPAKVPVVVSFSGYDTARDRFRAMLATGFPDEAAAAAKWFDGQLDTLLKGRTLTEVRKDARVYLTLHGVRELIEGGTRTAVLVPVTTGDKFRNTFLTADELRTLEKGADGVYSAKTAAGGRESTVYLTDLKDYVAVSFDTITAAEYAAKYTPATTAHPGPELAAALTASDAAVYVNMDVFNEEFATDLRGFKRFLEFFLQQALDQGKVPGASKAQINAMWATLRGVFQGIQDCRALVLAADFRPEGLAVRVQARFADNTPTAKVMRAEGSVPLSGVLAAPKGFGYYSESRLGDSFRDVMAVYAGQFVPAEGDETGAEALARSAKARVAAGPGAEWSAETATGTLLTVAQYADPPKAARAVADSYRAVGQGGLLGGTYVKAAPVVTDRTKTYRGFAFSVVRVRLDFEVSVNRIPDGQLRDVMRTHFKQTRLEEYEVWLGAGDKAVVQINATDWDAAKTALDAHLDGKQTVAGEAGFRLTRGHLPDAVATTTLAETGLVVSNLAIVARTFAPLLPEKVDVPHFPPPKGAPTYLGFAVTVKADTVSLAAFVPSKAMAVARKMVLDATAGK